MNTLVQLLKFAGVGAIATLVHVCVALVASMAFGFAPQAANVSGFAAAVAFSYFGQGRVTFEQDLEHRFHGPRFLATAFAGLIVSSSITEIVAVWYSAPFAVAMAAVAVAVPLTTYLLCRFWVFRPVGGNAVQSDNGP